MEEYSKDCVLEVAETCQLALSRIQWLKSNSNSINLQKSPYMSVDPAPPTNITNIKKLKEILLDENISLFERYRAMFSLRNINTSESILALSEGKIMIHYSFFIIIYLFFFINVIYNFKNVKIYCTNRSESRKCFVQT